MKITKRQRQIRRIVKEEKRRVLKRRLAKSLYEEQGYDAREDEHLGAEHGAVASHEFDGNHEEEEHARRDDAGFEERLQKLERHHAESQGYDAREDEHLGAEHGAAAEHDQDYKDRRDDAGFETHHESTARGGRKLRISKRQLMRIIREERAKIKK